MLLLFLNSSSGKRAGKTPYARRPPILLRCLTSAFIQLNARTNRCRRTTPILPNLGTHAFDEALTWKFIILGAGGLGSVIGAHLARTGVEVTLVARPPVANPGDAQAIITNSLGASARYCRCDDNNVRRVWDRNKIVDANLSRRK